MEPSTVAALVLGLLSLGAVGVGYLVNLIVRRPVVNPWFLGLGALVLLGAGNAWMVVRSGMLNTAEAFQQGERFGEQVAGPVTVPLLLLLWRAKIFSRRDQGPERAKGTFLGALGVTVAFVVFMAVLIGVIGPLFRTGGDSARRGSSSDVRTARSAAVARMAAELSPTLPKVVDEETELFAVSAEGDTLVYDYEMVNVLKGDVNAEAIEAFRAQLVTRACGNPTIRDKLLRSGVLLRHRYHDKVREPITSVDIAWKDCR